MNLPDQRLRIVILGDSLTTENTCYSLFLKNGVYFSMYTLPMNSELSRQSMSPAAESDADHFRGICVWQFYRENKSYHCCFFLQLEERNFIAFSLKSVLGAGWVGKEKTVKIWLLVLVCGSWQHSPLVLRYWWMSEFSEVSLSRSIQSCRNQSSQH